MDHDKAIPVAFLVELVVCFIVGAIAVCEMTFFWVALHSGARYAGSGDDLVVNLSLFIVWLMPVVLLSAWLIYETVRRNLRANLVLINPSCPLLISLLPVLFVYVNSLVFDPQA